MADKKQELDDKEHELLRMQDMLLDKVDKVETLLQNVAKTLADNTNYATLVTAPKYTGNRLKFIQLSQVEPGQVLMVIVTDGNLIKNKIIQVDTELDNETLLKLNLLLNSSLNGLTVEEINLTLISKLTGQAGEYSKLIYLMRWLRLQVHLMIFRYIPAVQPIFLNTLNYRHSRRQVSLSQHLKRRRSLHSLSMMR